MSITLYTAPDCIRCRVVKSYLADKNIPYDTIDFQEQKDTFNAFYRANRPSIYRNPEGVEFPLFHDGEVIKQGSGEVIAHLLSGKEMEGSVTRSDLLHGWISGLYPSLCPKAHEDHYVELVNRLAAGGLKVYLQPDGRNPGLLRRLIETGKLTKVVLNILGPASVYESAFGGPLDPSDLAESVALVKNFPNHEIRLLISPVKRADGWSWLTKEEAGEAAKMLAEACKEPQLPFGMAAVTAEMPQGLHGLEPFASDQMLPYRSAVRRHMFKADISSAEAV